GEVVLVLGLEQPFGGATALEPDERGERGVRCELAAYVGHGDGGHFLLARAVQIPSARLAAHLVMSPAPMQMIMSSSAARSRRAWHRSSTSVTARTMR